MKAKTTPRFDELYKGLNAKQKEAVDTIEGPVMVVAGPGTGKTTILTLRIANILLRTDTPPSGILAITFTEAGAKAMRMKLKDVIGATAHEVRIHTFHGFAASVIAEFKDHFPHLDGIRQLTDVGAEALMREVLEAHEFRELRPFGNPDFYVAKILSSISEAKRDALTPDMVRDYAKSVAKATEADESSYSTRGKTKGELKGEAKKAIEKCERTLVFASVYEAYEAKKKAAKCMDFDDLIIEVLMALRTDKLLLQILQERFLYLLIDEHQDTNDAQNELVGLLANFFDSPNVFIVGDEKQAIYRFQGASVENFLRFGKAWRDMKVVGLEDNYRSQGTILDAAFSMVENNYAEGEHADLRVKLRPGAKHAARPVSIVEGGDTAAAETYLAERLKEIQDKEPKATVAIIVKTNKDLSRVLNLCAREGVAVSSERSIDIFKHPAGGLFFDLAGFFHEPSRTDLLARTLVSGLWDVPFEDAVALARRLRSGEHADLEKAVKPLAELNALKISEGPMGFVAALAEKSGYLKAVSRDPDAVEVLRGIMGLCESLTRDGNLSDPRELLSILAAYELSSQSRSVKVPVGAPELSIRAMTAHGSKGLEFDHVFIPYATEESWVGRAHGSYFVLPASRAEGDIKDVRRLFYVALTRARKHATVLYGLEEEGREALTPLRFLDELGEDNISHIQAPKASKRAMEGHFGPAMGIFAKKAGDYAKRVISDSGLSVTALNHFLSCPNTFLYQSVLKLPQAPAPGAEKGNAMHQAIAEVWTKKAKGKAAIGKILEEQVSGYFETSLLPAFVKAAVKVELLENAPAVAKSLESHFETSGTVFPETWSETALALPGGRQIPIHGKLDAVVDEGESVSVYDYKTREAMSENEIRGLTKNGSGDYFRQLVFYKMLLRDDSRFKGKRVEPSLIFLKPDKKGECGIVTLPVTEEDMEKVEGDIRALAESVWSGEFLNRFCDDPECPWCALRKATL